MTHNRSYQLLFLLLFSFTHRCEAQQRGNVPASPPEQKNWKLVWSDEFNSNGLPDSTKWDYQTGSSGWGNQELQNYTANDANTAVVRDGSLRITANKRINGNDTSYSSARLLTRNKAAWKYARVEIRARVPRGRGICSALWMMPADCGNRGGWPECGEIDIMEHIGWGNNKDSIFQTVHTGAYNHVKKTQRGVRTYMPNAVDSFHVYAMEWNTEGLHYYIDGQARYYFPNEHKTQSQWPFDAEFYSIMNISVGGKWEGAQGIDPQIFPATMEVDYIRVYQPKTTGVLSKI